MEGRVGGRILEKIRGGREVVWGTITAWEPPRRVAFTWHPGQAPSTAQDVEVRFAPSGARTRVELEHRGFERLGALGRRARRGYPIGWAYVLGLYADHRGPFMWLVGGLTTLLMALQRLRAKRVESAGRLPAGRPERRIAAGPDGLGLRGTRTVCSADPSGSAWRAAVSRAALQRQHDPARRVQRRDRSPDARAARVVLGRLAPGSPHGLEQP